jgi:hypothetical protein
MVDKTADRKLKIEQHEPHLKHEPDWMSIIIHYNHFVHVHVWRK